MESVSLQSVLLVNYRLTPFTPKNISNFIIESGVLFKRHYDSYDEMRYYELG